jgi:hypothetical protein
MKTLNRLELIEKLEIVQDNIQRVEKQINQKIEDTTYYMFFGYVNPEFEHDKQIRTKALQYWKRLFNRIINQLKY